ncbi:MAG TPA: hypothetical protein VMJ10_12510 [Kofleriaceae bacterium]|nr:hypothetical protein [Kofleriaceae bacterium]
MRALALVLACLAACASSHSTAQSGGAPPMQPGRTPDSHAQIEQLAQQIDDARAKLALAEPPASTAITATPMSTPVSSTTDDKCHPAPSQTCTDTCTLADAICGNAQKICDIAVQLAGDGWAAQKCDSAKHTCDDAHAKCCACQ